MISNSPDGSGGTRRSQPESFRARSLWASLTVKDVEKSLAWYRDVLGFTLDQRHEREGKLMAASVKAGDVRILLAADDGAKGWDRVKGEGISLQVVTGADIDETAKLIKARGGVLDMEPTAMPWGAKVFRLRDPDGFRLAISSDAR